MPKNEQENTDYYNAFSSIISSVETVALGLTDSVIEGKWTDSDGRKANFTKWDINEPNNMNEQDFAAFWYPGAKWTTKIPKAWDDLGGHEKVSIFCDISAVCDLGELNVQVGKGPKSVRINESFHYSNTF